MHLFFRSFLFGDNTDLNFLGSKPVPFPYPPPQANEPTKTLKSLVNIRRDSLHFKKLDVVDGPKKYNIEFTFDCDVRVAITIYYQCAEEVTPTGVVLTPRDKGLVSATYQYRRGAGQVFSQPDYVFTPEQHEAELGFSPHTDLLPVAIHCVAEEGEEPRQSHLTIAVVEKQSDEHYSLKAIKQKLFVDGLCYLLQEIYGIENKVSTETAGSYGDEDDVEDTGAECVVCMCDMRDTLILPCRHLCLCNACADSLRYQANNCPICRAPFRALLQIRALAKSGHSATHPALAAEAHTDGIPPGYELVNLVEALNGPLTVPQQTVTLASETQDQEAARSKKKSRRRGSRDQQQRDKERRVSVPAPVEEPLPAIAASPQPIVSLSKLKKRKESITIDIDNGESSSDHLDLVQEELEKDNDKGAVEVEQEPEATTEDELLKDEKAAEAESDHKAGVRDQEEAEEEECEESESCSVSLRSSKQIQSLPQTPRSSDSTRSSGQSAESVTSTKHLLSTSSTPQTQVRPRMLK